MLVKKNLSVLLLSLVSLVSMAAAAPSFAQDWGGPGAGGPGAGGPGDQGGPMERGFRGGERGRWWDNPQVAQQIGLTDDQKKKMDDILQQHRLQLIDLNAALQKQEVLMRPMIEADQPDEAKVLSQIDAIASARADLEKANARMLFDIRKELTPDQWKKVQTLVHDRMADRKDGWSGGSRRGGPGGSGAWKRGPNGGPDSGNGNTPPPPPPQNAPASQ
jgi:periplasmic protein CpxP/Spy